MQDVRENVGAPSNLHKQRRSPDCYTSYMDLMTELVEIKPSSFKEVVEKPVCVDAMVEEYESILKNNVWEVVQIQEKKTVVSSRWIFKVNHATDKSIEK